MTISLRTPDGMGVSGGYDGVDDSEPAVRTTFADSRTIGVLVAAVALAIALVAVPNWPAGVFQDDGIYVILGKALATGEGYRYLNLPGAPYATHYPPGYPLFLALLWRVSPQFPQNV